MITFYLPDFYYNYRINQKVIELLNTDPECFKYKTNIGAVYGCFPNQIWNGGRVVKGTEPTISNIINTVDGFNKVGVPVRFTYTNCLIEKQHLDDVYCNFVTNYANNGMNEILVNRTTLEDYLRKKYKNYKFISSATRCLRDIDKINEYTESGKYYLVLGDYRDNFDFDFLSKLKNKDKIEILINPYCKRDCKIRDLHYLIISRKQLDLEAGQDLHCECPWLRWYELVESDHIIKTDDLQKYIDMGFKHFKIEGRNMPFIDVIDSYVYYLIKPEHRDKIRNILLQTMTEQ